MGQRVKAEKDKTERATGPESRQKNKRGDHNIQREKSGIKLTALRFQTGGSHQKPPPPFGESPPKKKHHCTHNLYKENKAKPKTTTKFKKQKSKQKHTIANVKTTHCVCVCVRE